MQKQHLDKSSFYDAHWKEWNDMILYSPAPRFRREKVLSWLKQLAANSLLDVGCGNGSFLQDVSRVMPGATLTGADISAAIIDLNRINTPDIGFYKLDIDAESLPNKFDAVVCMEVIEHCNDHRAAIKRLAAMTGKWLLITVPCGPLFEIDRRVGHTKHFKAEEIVKALNDEGLWVIKQQQWGFPFFNLYKHAINIWPDRMCESFLSKNKYTMRQKMMTSVTYAAFKLCLPKWGYQLFVMAGRP